MFIYLPEIKSRSGETVDYQFNQELADIFDEFSDGGNLKLMVSVSHSGEEILIGGSMEAGVAAVCSRCLEPFTQTVRTDFMEAFTIVKSSPVEDDPEQLAEEAANMLTVSGDILYLDEYIRQLIVLTQEYSPLCKPDCKGICSGCGTDLNQSLCRCLDQDSDQIDVRLLKLKELKTGN